MNPYTKAFQLSLGLHLMVAVVLVIGVLSAELFKPKPAAIFTVFAPPAGMIAGGASTTAARETPPEVMPVPQGPRLPSPPPAQTQAKPESKKEPAEAKRPEARKPAKKEVAPATPPKPPAPTPTKPRPTSATGTLPRTKPAPAKMSFAEFQKKYSPKPAAPKSTPERSNTRPNSTRSSAPSPSFEERLASRLDRRFQEAGQTSIGAGLGGAAGSGVAGVGTPGATDNADALYSGAVYTYLNSVWEEPREVGTVRMSARVEFTVNPRGIITQWRMTRRSGNEAFDRSVERVFAQVRELNPPPSNQDYRLSVTFETRDS